MNVNEPLSEQWYQVATKWAEADAAAELLEQTKSAVMSQMMMRLETIKAVASKEIVVKASSEWTAYVKRMVEARKHANKLKVEMEYLRMKVWEQNSHAANERVMARLG
jgi:hypothetical protein